MMKLKVLGSGSSGNCYLLSTENETLILDCGLPIMEIKKGLDFDLSKVVGCIISHAHHDHDKSAEDIKNMGIRVWQPYLYEVEMKRVQRRYFGGFMVKNFDVPHDNENCCGFIIECPNGERLLYATDFEYIGYSFKKMGIHHALIESNYQNKYVDKSASNREHVLRGHCELGTTLGVIEDNRDSLRTVILCHLSQGNANPIEMVEEVKKAVKSGVYVDYARKRLEVELKTDECPF